MHPYDSPVLHRGTHRLQLSALCQCFLLRSVRLALDENGRADALSPVYQRRLIYLHV